jgi:superfamily II DNA/RNA helicase
MSNQITDGWHAHSLFSLLNVCVIVSKCPPVSLLGTLCRNLEYKALPLFLLTGDVIVFASQRAKVDALVTSLQAAGVKAAGIHGDMDQVRFIMQAC